MKNFWIKQSKAKNRFVSRQYMDEPILRRDYVDMAAALHIYRTELEHAQGIYERSRRVILKG